MISPFFVAALVLFQRGTVDGEYVPTGAGSDEICSYLYSATLTKMMGGVKSTLRISTDVNSLQESEGTFGELKASRFCVDLENTMIASQNGLDNDGRLQDVSQQADELLKEPFCFIQTSDGKVVSVEHSTNDEESVVNMKKGIAAAFQANFKKTAQEIEEDTESRHVSHYRYKTIGEDHVIMYRRVNSKNVAQISSKDPTDKSATIQKSETIEYLKKVLQSSEGTVQVIVNEGSKSEPFSYQNADGDTSTYDSDSSLGSDELSGTGKYSLKIQKCSQKTKVVRRSVDSQMFTKSKLHVTAQDNCRLEMNLVRSGATSIKPQLTYLHSNITDTSTSNIIRHLLKLEFECKHLPGVTPAVQEIIDYLSLLTNSSSEKDTEMRVLLYSFLSAEGSIDSQKALLKHLSIVKDLKERNTLTVMLAFVVNAHPDTLAQMEALIASSNDPTDTLVLSYGALASSLSPDLQLHIVRFLVEHIDKTTDPSILVHYIHALGNTQSLLSNSVLVRFMSNTNSDVKLSAVYALRYSTGNEEVQSAFLHSLQSDPSEALTEMVLRSLIAGTETNNQPISDQLFETILTTIHQNSTETRMLLSYYIHLLGPNAPTKWSVVLLGHLKKRGTVWNERNALYDLVQDSATRDSDVTTYPINKAYIWGKSFGASKVSMDTAFGAFAGFGGKANPSSYKLFAKGIARAQAFGRSKTVFEALLLSERKPSEDYINNKLYATIVGKVLVNYNKQIPVCKTWNYPLYRSPTYTLLKFSYRVFIYVGFLTFEVSLTAKLSIDASLNACVRKCISAKGSLLPSVTVSASADATGSLAEIVRGGISLTASFTYQVALQLSGQYVLTSGPFGFCVKLLHGWPDNKLSIYAFYQIRSIKTCKKNVPYPCGVKICHKNISYPCGISWSGKRKWDKLSKEWKLPSKSLTTLWSSCGNSLQQC